MPSYKPFLHVTRWETRSRDDVNMNDKIVPGRCRSQLAIVGHHDSPTPDTQCPSVRAPALSQSPLADTKEIKRAYYSMMRTCHPDRSVDFEVGEAGTCARTCQHLLAPARTYLQGAGRDAYPFRTQRHNALSCTRAAVLCMSTRIRVFHIQVSPSALAPPPSSRSRRACQPSTTAGPYKLFCPVSLHVAVQSNEFCALLNDVYEVGGLS